MPFHEWITSLGVPAVCKLLNVGHNTVYLWRDLQTLPKPRMMKKVVTVTHGLVSYESIIEPYLAHKRNANKG